MKNHIETLKCKIANSTDADDIATWSELLKSAEAELKPSKKELIQHIAELRQSLQHTDAQLDVWKKIHAAEGLLNKMTSKIVATVGLVNWWYSTETGDSTISYEGAWYEFKAGAQGADAQFGCCVLDALVTKGVVE